jgi:WD40 repeat protein
MGGCERCKVDPSIPTHHYSHPRLVCTINESQRSNVILAATHTQVWDMESFSCRRTLRGHDDDVLSLALWGGFLFR